MQGRAEPRTRPDSDGRSTHHALRQAAIAAALDLDSAPARAVVEWAVDTFGDRLAVTSSMDDIALVHLASTVKSGIDVIFLDTGYHFAETLDTRDRVAADLDVNVISVRTPLSIAAQDEEYGRDLFARDPDLCCTIRKVRPLTEALEKYDAWATGLRRDQTLARANTPTVTWDEARGKVKISPLARWTAEDVAAYIRAAGVIDNPLRQDGYPSVGCRPCTRRVSSNGDPRSGRWAGTEKTECGIHQ